MASSNPVHRGPGVPFDDLAGCRDALVPPSHVSPPTSAGSRRDDTRFAAARRRAATGDGPRVDATDVDPCHRVWFELHEDLVATLGLQRGAEG